MEKQNVSKCKAPAEGLYLLDIIYDDKHYLFHEKTMKEIDLEYNPLNNEYYKLL